MEKLLKLLREEGGMISLASDLDDWDVRQARASGRMYVDIDNKAAYIWYPNFSKLPTNQEELEAWEALEEKWFPLDEKRPLPTSLDPKSMLDRWAAQEEEERQMRDN